MSSPARAAATRPASNLRRDHMNGSLVLILHTHLPYVLHHGTWPHGSEWVCEAAAECYIPLLNECHALLEEGIRPSITFSLTPVVVEQLADPIFPTLFVEWLDNRIEGASEDRRAFEQRVDERHYVPLAIYWQDWFAARKRDFIDRYGSDLVGSFRALADQGIIALQTSAATHGYLPLLGSDQSIRGQLSTAVSSHQRHFGSRPRGFWMPECAYRPCYDWHAPVDNPWSVSGVRMGIEQLMALYDLEYTVVDSHLTRGGRPLGFYAQWFRQVSERLGGPERFLPLDDARSVHELYRISSTGSLEPGSPAIFTRDADTTLKVWSGAYGYPGDPDYLEFHKRHHNNGHRYWRVTDAKADLAMKDLYRPERVEERLKVQAAHFVGAVNREMSSYRERTGRLGTLAAPFDTELFGHWWFEGPRFLGHVMRFASQTSTVALRTASAELDAKDPGVVIQIPEGSWGDGGGHGVWFNHATEWTWPPLYQAERRFLDLLGESDPVNRIEVRALQQLAREVLLLQSSDWQFLITTESAADYASERFQEHFDNAMRLADTLEAMRRREPVSLAQLEDLFELESVNRPFPFLDLDAWRN